MGMYIREVSLSIKNKGNLIIADGFPLYNAITASNAFVHLFPLMVRDRSHASFWTWGDDLRITKCHNRRNCKESVNDKITDEPKTKIRF